jgi:hypothetical protein
MLNGATRSFPLSGSCGLPPYPSAFSLKVTVAPTGLLGFETTWPTATPQAAVSTLNDPKGFVIANAALVPAGDGGAVSVYVLNTTHVILDVNGYFAH